MQAHDSTRPPQLHSQIQFGIQLLQLLQSAVISVSVGLVGQNLEDRPGGRNSTIEEKDCHQWIIRLQGQSRVFPSWFSNTVNGSRSD